MPFGRELWIEREDLAKPRSYYHLPYLATWPACAMATPSVHRLREGRRRQRHRVLLCEYPPDPKSGTLAPITTSVKGNLHRVSVEFAYAAEVRLYDRLFAHAYPGDPPLRANLRGDDFTDDIHANNLPGSSPPSSNLLPRAARQARFQFERHGYFVADRARLPRRRAGVQPQPYAPGATPGRSNDQAGARRRYGRRPGPCLDSRPR